MKDFNQFVIDVQNSLNSTKAMNVNATIFDTDTFGVESNLGKNFYDLAVVSKKLKTVRGQSIRYRSTVFPFHF